MAYTPISMDRIRSMATSSSIGNLADKINLVNPLSKYVM